MFRGEKKEREGRRHTRRERRGTIKVPTPVEGGRIHRIQEVKRGNTEGEGLCITRKRKQTVEREHARQRGVQAFWQRIKRIKQVKKKKTFADGENYKRIELVRSELGQE